MPNEISNEFHKVEDWVEGEAKAFAAAVDREWAQIRPDIVAIGKTIASEVLAAASVYVSGGATLDGALKSVLVQLPAEAKAAEHLVSTLLGLAVTKLKTP